MARDHFMISTTNPNERSGGGGCLCSEAKIADAKGPFIVFHGVETDNPFSPYAVLCADCACNAASKSGILQPAIDACVNASIDAGIIAAMREIERREDAPEPAPAAKTTTRRKAA